jgi:hypothetical protein
MDGHDPQATLRSARRKMIPQGLSRFQQNAVRTKDKQNDFHSRKRQIPAEDDVAIILAETPKVGTDVFESLRIGKTDVL